MADLDRARAVFPSVHATGLGEGDGAQLPDDVGELRRDLGACVARVGEAFVKQSTGKDGHQHVGRAEGIVPPPIHGVNGRNGNGGAFADGVHYRHLGLHGVLQVAGFLVIVPGEGHTGDPKGAVGELQLKDGVVLARCPVAEVAFACYTG